MTEFVRAYIELLKYSIIFTYEHWFGILVMNLIVAGVVFGLPYLISRYGIKKKGRS